MKLRDKLVCVMVLAACGCSGSDGSTGQDTVARDADPGDSGSVFVDTGQSQEASPDTGPAVADAAGDTGSSDAPDDGLGDSGPQDSPPADSGSVTDTAPPVPVCGNGVVEAGEECDDGNAAKCDGCEGCQNRYVFSHGSASSPSAAAAFNSGDICAETWFYVDPGTPYPFQDEYALFDAYDPSTGTTDMGVILLKEYVNVVTSSFSGLAGLVVRAQVPFSLGTWTHLAVCRSGQTYSVFLNGSLSAKSSAANLPPSAPSATQFAMGPHSSYPAHFPGKLDELRVTSGNVYQSDFVPTRRFDTDAATSLLYHMDERTGSLLRDASGHGRDAAVSSGGWDADTGYRPEMCQ